MQIFPHIHQIQSCIADRHLFQYLFVGDNTTLLDTGFSTTPKDVIFPFMHQLGLGPERLRLAVNTHADADHHGGNAGLKGECENVLLACGELDREVIESPDRLFASRYNQWLQDHGVGLGTNPAAETWVREMTGPPQTIDLSFRGGEHIMVSDQLSLRVLHLPGHSNGHLAFYDSQHRAVYVGDALHGNCCPSREGKPSLPPAYFAVLAYLASIQTVEALKVDCIFSAHWPTYSGPQVNEFLSECRRFVDHADTILRHALEQNPEGLTLRECIEKCGTLLGHWPKENQWLLMYPVHGHLSYLEQSGIIKQDRSTGAVRWRTT
jgi:glyoxylase-like metal-dependent hydrolase (beta-lactamase superfamily II)